MPTAAKLMAAVCLALVGFLTSELIKATSTEEINFGYLSFVNLGLGLVCGWIIVGPRAGHGWSAAINNGVTGTVALVFWGLFVQGVNEMVRLAFKSRYDSMFEAIADVFEHMGKFGLFLLDANVIVLLIGGALVTGIASEAAERRWG
jgi:hypothetical protein